MFPKGGDEAVFDRLSALSRQERPTAKDRAIVQDVARLFRIDPDIRRKVTTSPRFRNAMERTVNEGKLNLGRSRRKDTPLWSAEVILHFEREDWDAGIPDVDNVYFQPYYRAAGADTGQQAIIPVYRVDEFKGLESDAVVLFFPANLPIAEPELYVGASRARLVLSVLIDEKMLSTLPPAVLRFWHKRGGVGKKAERASV
jgi:hypothetical protein